MIERLIGRMELSSVERSAVYRIVTASLFGGIMSGTYVILPELARNTLHAEAIFISLITLLWPVGQLFAAYWGQYLDGLPDKSRVLVLVGLFGRFPFVFSALFSSVEPMIALFALTVITAPAVTASQHSIIQGTIRREYRGKLFSVSVSVMMMSTLVVALLSGYLLDMNEQNYRWIVMVTALAGLLEAFSLSRVKVPDPRREVFKASTGRNPVDAIIRPWLQMWRLFAKDRAFMRYEVNFFVYGIGFMLMQPFITLFLVNDLNLNYSQISLAKGGIMQSMVIVLAPLMGRLFDRQNPVLYASFVFLLMTMFPLALVLVNFLESDEPQLFVYFAYALFSMGWSGIIIVWNLGSMFFARKKDVARYSGAHVVLVGVRGLVVLIASLFLVDWIKPATAFMIVAGFWILAAVLMLHQWLTQYRVDDDDPKDKDHESASSLGSPDRPGL